VLFPFIALAFDGFPPWDVMSDRSLGYSAGFGGLLRGKLENFRTQITRMVRIRERWMQRDDFGCLAKTGFLHRERSLSQRNARQSARVAILQNLKRISRHSTVGG
jgi:hypothetical protein